MKNMPRAAFFCTIWLLAFSLYGDWVELENGDHLTGEITGMTKAAVKITTGFGTVEIPRKQIKRGFFGDIDPGDLAREVEEQEKAAGEKENSVETDRNPVPTDGLVLEYLFAGNLEDTSGNRQNPTSSGNIFFAPDSSGTALSAVISSGTGTYLTLEPGETVNRLESFTLSLKAFIKSKGKSQYFFSKWSKTREKMAEGKFALSYGNGAFYFYIVDEKGLYHGLKVEEDVPLEEWMHLAAQYHRGRMAFYINGEKKGEKKIDSSGLYKDNAPVYFMTARAFNDTPWSFYNLLGAIDNVRLYDRELPELEIRNLASE